MKKLLLLYIVLTTVSMAVFAETQAIGRGAWFYDETNTSTSADPSSLKYLKYYDQMPDEIVLEAFKNIDLSQLGDKKTYI